MHTFCKQEFLSAGRAIRSLLILSAASQQFSSWMRNRLPLHLQHNLALQLVWRSDHHPCAVLSCFSINIVLTWLPCLSNSIILSHQSCCWVKCDSVYEPEGETVDFLGVWKRKGEAGTRCSVQALVHIVRTTRVTSLLSHQLRESSCCEMLVSLAAAVDTGNITFVYVGWFRLGGAEGSHIYSTQNKPKLGLSKKQLDVSIEQ